MSLTCAVIVAVGMAVLLLALGTTVTAMLPQGAPDRAWAIPG